MSITDELVDALLDTPTFFRDWWDVFEKDYVTASDAYKALDCPKAVQEVDLRTELARLDRAFQKIVDTEDRIWIRPGHYVRLTAIRTTRTGKPRWGLQTVSYEKLDIPIIIRRPKRRICQMPATPEGEFNEREN